MNHATWSLGSTSMAACRVPVSQRRRPSRTLSASPKGEKSSRRKKSQPCLCAGYPYEKSEEGPHSPGSGNILAIQNKTIPKSPSAPNLQPGATSMLALQGSLTAFTAMAAGKATADKSNTDSKPQSERLQIKAGKSSHLGETRRIESSHFAKAKSNEGAQAQSSKYSGFQSQTTELKSDSNKQNTVSETIMDGQNKKKISDQREHVTTTSKKGNVMNMTFKETRV